MPTIKEIEDAFHDVRKELEGLGLLYRDVYLDEIEICPSYLPPFQGEAGFVYDEEVPWYGRLVGFQPGYIYIPTRFEPQRYVPGGTLVDVIRHEFAHAWAWLDRRYINQHWFSEAFGGGYGEVTAFGEKASALFMEYEEEFRSSSYALDYVSPYAMMRPAEDFAETFMMFLRNKNQLRKYRGRPGVYRKLRAVKEAVRNKARVI